jgi:positive regulator of sigma E activity
MKIAQNLEKIQTIALPNFEFSGNQGDIGSIVSSLLNYLFPLAGILLLLYLLLGGFSLMTSGGDPKAVQAAKSKITNALIGFIIIFAAYWIVQLVASILGLDAITNIFG